MLCLSSSSSCCISLICSTVVLSSITTNGYFDNVKGQVTGTKMKVLDTNEFTGSAKWIYSANYYDDRYRVIQSRRTLYDGSTGGVETLASQYDFTGRVAQTKLAQTFNSVTTTVNKYLTYDPQGRLTKTEQEIENDANNGRVTTAENVYNEIGQLIEKKLHKVVSNYLQNVDYTYNIRGWLKSINDPDNLSGDLFAEKLFYEGTESELNSNTTAQYNGNISAMVLRSNFKDFKRGYEFTYDGLNRLTQGDFKSNNGAWVDSTSYEERSLAYDLNGNITRLQRTDGSGGYSADFTYAYSGNQLANINSGTSYTYDQNGNTTLDGLRGMSIGYNVLNLPNSITKSSDNITYIYSATGEKLAKRDKNNLYQYYAGNMVYNNGKSLNYIIFEEGLVTKSSSAYTYEYHLKDHLGNTRVAFQPNGSGTTTTQVAEYYPFGSSYLPISPAGTNKYLYNGKEKQDDVLGGYALDEYDYGARFYDPTIGRWHIIDNKAEKYFSLSQYIYALDDPVKFIDPDGNEVILSYLSNDAHKTAFNNLMSTPEGRAFIGQYLNAGEHELNGVKYTFSSDGARAKDNLYFETADQQSTVNMDAGAVDGMTRTFTKDMGTELSEATEQTDIKAGVAEVITMNGHLGKERSTAVLSHEAFVHGQKDADKLNSIDKKEASGAYKGKISEKITDLQSVGNSGKSDHKDFAKKGNKAYESASQRLDKKGKTNYYEDYYNKDKNSY